MDTPTRISTIVSGLLLIWVGQNQKDDNKVRVWLLAFMCSLVGVLMILMGIFAS